MSTIKNGQILLCYFNKMIKGPGTSFQSPVLNQKHVCHMAHYYLTKFHFDGTEDSKETTKSLTSIMY